MRDKRAVLITSVANDLPTFVSIYTSMKTWQKWLKDPANKSDTARDDYMRPRDEVSKAYFELAKMYLQARKPESILADVEVFFDSPEVRSLVKKEQDALDAIHDAETRADVAKRADEQDKVGAALLKAMAIEIRQPLHGE